MSDSEPRRAREADGRVRKLRRKVGDGQADTLATAALVRQASGLPLPAAGELPAQLTARARRLVMQAHQLVSRLRGGAARLAALTPHTSAAPATLHRETVALTELAVRVMQQLPSPPEAQLAWCEGLEGVLQTAATKAARLENWLNAGEREAGRVAELAGQLTSLAAGHSESWSAFVQFGEALCEEAAAGTPLPLYLAGPLSENRYHPAPLEPARLVACHALNVAQVLARLVRHDKASDRPAERVAAALVMDVGMLRVAREAWIQAARLTPAQRRQVESHVRLGGERLVRLTPPEWVQQAVLEHHERCDGTGYPGGKRGPELVPFARLLAVADTYAAFLQPRPHRAAHDSRSALAETLLEVERGRLDENLAQRLLQLSLYPVGTLVELADGATGLVVGTHMGPRDPDTPARPVVALLTNALGEALPTPRHVDLNDNDAQSIVRALPPAERQRFLQDHPAAA